ncbi:unnamed protein product [Linum trigynum]|uniref:Uncharacterized protein n=1 Tax=Linum trigynum TaxID=586398 RepID=A0AAV2D989_9ROSI
MGEEEPSFSRPGDGGCEEAFPPGKSGVGLCGKEAVSSPGEEGAGLGGEMAPEVSGSPMGSGVEEGATGSSSQIGSAITGGGREGIAYRNDSEESVLN